MMALLIAIAMWIVVAPAVALVLGAVLHRRDAQVPGAVGVNAGATPGQTPVARAPRSSTAA